MNESALSTSGNTTLDPTSRLLEQLISNPLAHLGIDALEVPSLLPWLGLLVLVATVVMLSRRRSALAWPGMTEARRSGGHGFELVPVLSSALRAAALACLALVIARPVAIHESPPEPGHGLDLILVLDTSASMRALDTSAVREAGGPAAPSTAGSYARTRLDLATDVVSRFATERVAEGDRVGLVVFGSTAFTQCPLTSDGELLAASLERVEVGIAGEATALGDALALAVKRAPRSDTSLGRVIVLLTDGRSNSGRVPVGVAIELARGEHLRVHTVGIGTGGTEVPVAPRAGRPQQPLRFERHDTDPDTLRRIAVATNGKFFAATRASDLSEVYREIDSLERAERLLPPRIRRSLRAEPLLATAGALLMLEIALAGVLRRRVP